MQAFEWLERAERRLKAAKILFDNAIYEDCLFKLAENVVKWSKFQLK